MVFTFSQLSTTCFLNAFHNLSRFKPMNLSSNFMGDRASHLERALASRRVVGGFTRFLFSPFQTRRAS